MSHFIQSLESRVLLSATQATLLADKAAILADAATVRADVAALGVQVRADTRVIDADLKGLPKTNAPLARMLTADETKALATLARDDNALLNPCDALAQRSVTSGGLLLKAWSAALEKTIAADLIALGTITAAPLTQLQTDLLATTVGNDLQALAAANPTDSTLATDTGTQESYAVSQKTAINTAAVQFQTDIGTLASDLGTLPQYPNLVGTYVGLSHGTSGSDKGQVQSYIFDITSEGADGSLTGTSTISSATTGSTTNTFAGQVASTGVITFITTKSGGTTTLQCKLVGTTLVGTFVSGDGNGTFSFKLQ